MRRYVLTLFLVMISSLAAAQTPPSAPYSLPAPTANTLGGVKLSSAPSNEFVIGIDFNGNLTFGGGSAAFSNIGTSGGTVPLLNGANTWSAVQTFSSTPNITANQINFGGVNTLTRNSGTGALTIATNAANILMTPTGGTVAITGTLTASAIANAAGNEILCYNTSGGVITYEPSVATCVPSALRYKNPVGKIDLQEAEAGIKQLHPGFWIYKDTETFGDKTQVGLYADDVKKMDPRCVVYDKHGRLENYADRCVLAYLVATVQGQHREIATLKAELRKR